MEYAATDKGMQIRQDAIYLVYGDRPKEMVQMALNRLNPAAALHSGMVVGLKPNLVVPKPAHTGATTSPELIEGIIIYLRENGIHRIRIMESAAVGYSTRKAFKVTGLDSMAKRYGVELVDLKETPVETVMAGETRIRVFSMFREVDYLINLPVVKAHSQTRITCALKNLKGLIPDSEKRKFHNSGLHKPIARLNTVIRPHLIVADGIQGDLSFEEGGTPVRMDRILLATDPVRMDAYVASMLGYPYEAIQHLVLAEKLGVGRPFRPSDTVVELNSSQDAPQSFPRGRRLEPLLEKIDARQACSVCLGGLLHALERLRSSGKLNRIQDSIHIGQGFRKRGGEGIGIGRCTSGYSRTVDGCPPQAIDILNFLIG